MFIGFDYGSANCAVGIFDDGKVQLLPLTAQSPYLSSTLYAYDRELIAEAVFRQLTGEAQEQYGQARKAQLQRASAVRRELDLTPQEQAVFFGEQAFNTYIEAPEEGFYVRSPKSFLGASGLRPEQVGLFEDIVTLMMMHIKTTAEACLAAQGKPHRITHAVIGRPVNFQGIGGEQANQQAESILTTAATRAGFTQVQYLFEPIAAGMDFEAQLTEDKKVLVVDIGGGTTDCSLVQMGPSFANKTDRQADFFAHTGQRIGGNDFDIALAMYGIMPHFGLYDKLKSNKPMPKTVFWNGVAINNIAAQRDFASVACRKLILDLMKEADDPSQLQRLLTSQEHGLSYQIVRSAEQAKIDLSEQAQTPVDLDYVEADFAVSLELTQYQSAITDNLQQVRLLMEQAVTAAGVEPELIYVTGGSARSPAIYQCICQAFPDKQVIAGDHFGSVTAGLTRWAAKVFA